MTRIRPAARTIAVVVIVIVALVGTACSSGDGSSTASKESGSRPGSSGATPSTTTGGSGGAGASGVGDPYFPGAGNGGYDVESYDVTADIAIQGADQIYATATITATATEDLTSFDLDLLGFEVGGVTVQDEPAQVSRDGREMTVTPDTTIDAGTDFTVVVEYRGAPGTESGPGAFLEDGGWVDMDDYSVVIAEPIGAATWIPSNDHPSDKALFTLTATVPDPLEAVSNGNLVSRTSATGRSTFVWKADEPMSTYLMTVAVGEYELIEQPTTGGATILNAVPPAERATGDAAFARFPEMIAFFSGSFGPYPFTAAGNLIAPGLPPLALECQTRSVFGLEAVEGNRYGVEQIVSHELAHQWFGDAVSPATWRDIWLNESFATYGEWLWGEHAGGPTVEQSARSNHDQGDPALDVAPADPGVDELFGGAVYQRGGMFLVELQKRMGDEKFFTLLRTWVDEHKYGTATTAQFLQLAAEINGTSIEDLSQPWLYGDTLPELS